MSLAHHIPMKSTPKKLHIALVPEFGFVIRMIKGDLCFAHLVLRKHHVSNLHINCTTTMGVAETGNGFMIQ